MSLLSIIENKKIKKISYLGIIKICLIIFTSIFLLGNFTPFNSGFDSNMYGALAVKLANGTFEYTDPSGLLKETGKWEFIPHPLVKTVHNTAIPVGGIGIYSLSAFSYLIGGYYGLFYLIPICTIIFLIIAERISTKLFGNFVGLATLIFLSTDAGISNFGTKLLTDIPFSIFVLLGLFFLVRFLQERRNLFILISSICLGISVLFRFPGMIFFPTEILILVGYFSYKTIHSFKKTPSSISSKTELILIKLKNPNLLKISISVIIPWLIIFVGILIFNGYFFAEPFTLSYSERPFPPGYKIDPITTFFNFDTARANWLLFYSVSLIPDSITSVLNDIPSIYSLKELGNIWIGIFTPIIWIMALGISIYTKKKRAEIIILFIFSSFFLLFYSGSYLHSESYNIENYNGPSPGNQVRHMLPILSFSLIMFVFITYRIFKIDYKKIPLKFLIKSSKIFIYLAFILFSFLLIDTVFDFVTENFQHVLKFKNPEALVKKYPIDMEGLTEKSIIIGGRPGASLEYNSVAFFPFWESMPTIRHEWNPAFVSMGPINTLKEKITDGHDVYVFKSPNDRRNFETYYYRYLANEHSLILKDFSKNFCKMELIFDENKGISSMSQDEFLDCYSTRLIERSFIKPGEISALLESLPENFEGNLTIRLPVDP